MIYNFWNQTWQFSQEWRTIKKFWSLLTCFCWSHLDRYALYKMSFFPTVCIYRRLVYSVCLQSGPCRSLLLSFHLSLQLLQVRVLLVGDQLSHAGRQVVEVVNVGSAWSVACQDSGRHILQRIGPRVLPVGGRAKVECHPHFIAALAWVESVRVQSEVEVDESRSCFCGNNHKLNQIPTRISDEKS